MGITPLRARPDTRSRCLARARRLGAAAAALLSAAAAQAQAQWTFLDGPVLPGSSAAYDVHRQRLVVFANDGGTWEYDRGTQLHRAIAPGLPASPPARWRAMLEYDPLRRHVLLFGGQIDRSSAGDTWAYDGRRWTQLGGSPSPPPRVDAAMTFDGARGTVLMFGGMVLGQTVLADTWEHDGVQWRQRLPATVPQAINAPIATFDSQRGVVVMTTHPALLGASVHTSEWNGQDWQVRATQTGPVATSNGALAYDPVRQRSVFLSGANSNEQAWEWDGAAWTLAATNVLPSRLNPAVWFDPVRGRVQLRGGADTLMTPMGMSQGSWRSDTWEWDGTALQPVAPDSAPPTRGEPTVVAHVPRGELLMFGGTRELQATDETWAWTGNGWRNPSPLTRPPPRVQSGATYDWTNGRSLLFGGWRSPTSFGDFWSWDGTTWTQLTSATAPQPRSSPALAFDVARSIVVLFGGLSGTLFGGSLRNDTWEWNGTTWTQVPSVAAPSPRERPAATFDFGRGRVVLFGGRDGATAQDQFDDTWEWNGAVWTRIVTSPTPPALLQPSLTTDFTTLQPLLVGFDVAQQPMSVQVWSLSGSAWSQRLAVSSNSLAGHAAVDLGRNRLVMITGNGVAELAVVPAAAVEYGAGCGAPAPALSPRARPRIGEPTFGFEATAAAGQPALFALSFGQAATPLGGGCTLLLAQPLSTAPAVAGGNGLAVLPVPVPRNFGFSGIDVFAQAAVLDPAAPMGFATTQGLRVTLGD